MKDRIKKLRKSLELTQREFSERIGMKPNTIATYEMGRAIPSDPTINNICKEFNVNETWLRTGEGEIFIQKTRNDEISEFIGDILSGEPDFRRRLISVLSRMTVDEWKILEKKALELLDEMKNADSVSTSKTTQEPALFPDARSAWEKEADEFAEIARKQYLDEKKRESQALFVKESGVG